VSAAEGIRFVKVITEFDGSISDLGPLVSEEGSDRQVVMYKLKAAIKTVEGRTFRMAFARQAKQMKEENNFGQFPSKDKLTDMLFKEMKMNQILIYLQEKERSLNELTCLLGLPEEQVMGFVETLKKKKIWEGEMK
jgi:hypothetical protein